MRFNLHADRDDINNSWYIHPRHRRAINRALERVAYFFYPRYDHPELERRPRTSHQIIETPPPSSHLSRLLHSQVERLEQNAAISAAEILVTPRSPAGNFFEEVSCGVEWFKLDSYMLEIKHFTIHSVVGHVYLARSSDHRTPLSMCDSHECYMRLTSYATIMRKIRSEGLPTPIPDAVNRISIHPTSLNHMFIFIPGGRTTGHLAAEGKLLTTFPERIFHGEEAGRAVPTTADLEGSCRCRGAKGACDAAGFADKSQSDGKSEGLGTKALIRERKSDRRVDGGVLLGVRFPVLCLVSCYLHARIKRSSTKPNERTSLSIGYVSVIMVNCRVEYVRFFRRYW